MLDAGNPGTSRPVCAGLLWHSSNSDNLGVTALTASNIAIVEEAAREVSCGVRFIVLGWSDPGRHQISGPNVSVFPMRGKTIVQPGGLYAKLRECDFVLDISGGDSFADIYGAKRFMFNAMAKSAVIASGKPLILSPQTIGPFGRPWARAAARFLMMRAAAVVTRDGLSTAYARSLSIANVLEATDVAFRLPYTPPAAFPAPGGGAKVKVGINFSGLLLNGGYTGNNMFALKTDYRELVQLLMTRFLARPGCEVHLVSHVISTGIPVEDDYRVACAIAGRFPQAVVAPRFEHPSEAKSYIAGLDFFCGSRMHACIAAFSSGVPVVPMSYSRKFSGLFGTLGYGHVADCREKSAAEIADLVLQGFDGRAALKVSVDAGRAAALGKLEVYQQVLRQTLRAAVQRQSA